MLSCDVARTRAAAPGHCSKPSRRPSLLVDCTTTLAGAVAAGVAAITSAAPESLSWPAVFDAGRRDGHGPCG